MNVQQSNIMFALRIAIIDQERTEKVAGFTGESSMLVGLKQTYAYIAAGGQIHIVPSTN